MEKPYLRMDHFKGGSSTPPARLDGFRVRGVTLDIEGERKLDLHGLLRAVQAIERLIKAEIDQRPQQAVFRLEHGYALAYGMEHTCLHIRWPRTKLQEPQEPQERLS